MFLEQLLKLQMLTYFSFTRGNSPLSSTVRGEDKSRQTYFLFISLVVDYTTLSKFS
jgi:hypothetical protein